MTASTSGSTSGSTIEAATNFGFEHFAARDAARIAITESGGKVWSRGRLLALVHRLANAFVAAGLVAGDCVAVLAPNCAEYLAVYLACVRAGFNVVPINWHLAPSEVAFILENSGARAVVGHARLGQSRLAALAASVQDRSEPAALSGGPASSRAAARLLIAIGAAPEAAPGFVALSDFVAAHRSDTSEAIGTGRVLAYTSATTGRPKGVKLPAHNAHNALARIVAWHRSLGIALEDGNVHLCSSMLYHSAPLEGAIVALQMGHRVVLVERWDPEQLLRLIDEEDVTTTFMVPTMFVRLLKLPAPVRARYSMHTLRFAIHGGAPCPPEVKRRMIAWWGDIVWESYGAAEGQGAIVCARDWLRYPGTVGRAIPGSAIAIFDAQGRPAAPLQVGTVYLRPHTGDRFEYLGDPERTRQCYRGDLMTVGDLGYLNEAGYLFLCDRASDLIISSGLNIYPAEIEQVLVLHPGVLDCAVVGVPHALLGEVPKAFVQAAPGAQAGPALAVECLRFLAGRLSAMKLPKRIEFVEKIPRDPNGKLYRRQLKSPTRSDPDPISDAG
jgi:long-chain acyl-CoA synthetase